MSEKLTTEQRLDLMDARIGVITRGFSEILGELGKLDDVELAQDTRPWDPNRITWQEAEGSSGPYEKASDASNPDYQLLVKDLRSHDGKLSRSGFFYWLFTTGDAVGRKPKC